MRYDVNSLEELKALEDAFFKDSLLKEPLSFAVEDDCLVISSPLKSYEFPLDEGSELHWLTALTYVRAYHDGAIQQARDIHGI